MAQRSCRVVLQNSSKSLILVKTFVVFKRLHQLTLGELLVFWVSSGPPE